MALPNKEELKNNKARLEKVMIPEWGDDVYIYVKHPSIGQVLELSKLDAKQEEAGSVSLIIMLAADEEGNQYFQEEDKEWLMDQDAKALKRISEKALDIILEPHKETEERAKN